MCAGTHSNTESSGMVVALRLPGPPAWSQREQKHNLNPLHQNWLSVSAINWSRQLDEGVEGKLRGSRSLKTYKPCTSPAGSDESIKTIWSWLYSIHGQVRIPSAGHLSARGFQKSPYLQTPLREVVGAPSWSPCFLWGSHRLLSLVDCRLAGRGDLAFSLCWFVRILQLALLNFKVISFNWC